MTVRINSSENPWQHLELYQADSMPSNRSPRREQKVQRDLSAKPAAELLDVLRTRFKHHQSRHPGLEWAQVQTRLEARPERWWSLSEMERTGGEPDVVGMAGGECIFMDCSEQSPAGRTHLCYDREALEARREHKPRGSVMDFAAAMGIEVLSEEQYFKLQTLGEFDTRRSSWLRTPPEIRSLGGAIFGDRRFGRVFIYHNGAESYYSGRGFRGVLRV